MNGNDHGIATWDENMAEIRQAICDGRFADDVGLTVHAKDRKLHPERTHITELDLFPGLASEAASIIEGYAPQPAEGQFHPKRLVMTWGQTGFPLHISVILYPYGYGIATFYDPSQKPWLWETDFMTRKQPLHRQRKAPAIAPEEVV